MNVGEMAGRNRNQITKLEAAIEQCRAEGKWQRVTELSDELKAGFPQVGESFGFCFSFAKCLQSFLLLPKRVWPIF